MNYTGNNPAKVERNVSIADDRLAGATYRELSEAYQLSQAHISRILNDKEIREVLDTGTRLLVSRVPTALTRYDTILNDPEHSDHYKSIKDCLTATGIFPSHTANLTINNILNVTTGPQAEDCKRIQDLIATRHAVDVKEIDGDIVDVEPEVVNSDG